LGQWIRPGLEIRIRIQAGLKQSPKKGNNEEIHCLKSSLQGWRLLPEPESPLSGFRRHKSWFLSTKTRIVNISKFCNNKLLG
jgi:hypothetical protein